MTSASSQDAEQSDHSETEQQDDLRSLSAITSDLTRDLSELVRGEMALAKAEVRQEVSTASKAGVLLVGAALLGLLTLMLLAMSIAFLFANLGGDSPAFGLGFFLGGVLFAIPTAIVGLLARKRLQKVDPVPRATTESLSADVQAVRGRRA